MRVISYGGGVQSTALVVLAATGNLDVTDALFCNVGDDSEAPATIRYVHDVVMPWASERGVTVHELHKVNRTGERETLYGRLMSADRSVDIPVRMPNGAPGNRKCTHDFKMAVAAKWLRENGATPDNPCEVMIGFSTDEIRRVRNGPPPYKYERLVYPLLDMGLSRSGCQEVIRSAGLPVPPKSACYFCPFATNRSCSGKRRIWRLY